MKTVMVPVIELSGVRVPTLPGEAGELSRRLGEALVEAMGAEPVPADLALEVLAVWAAAIITVHPLSREYLASHFAEVLAAGQGVQ